MTNHKAGGLRVVTEVLSCERCGLDFHRVVIRGIKPTRCPECQGVRGSISNVDTSSTSYRLALAVTNYRCAIELATSALRMGHPAEALAALEQVIPKPFAGKPHGPQPRIPKQTEGEPDELTS